jgi:hypothetical protein
LFNNVFSRMSFRLLESVIKYNRAGKARDDNTIRRRKGAICRPDNEDYRHTRIIFNRPAYCFAIPTVAMRKRFTISLYIKCLSCIHIAFVVCFLLGNSPASEFYMPTLLHTYLPMKMEQSVPKRRHIKFRRRGITHKKEYNIHNTAKFEIKNNLCLFSFLWYTSLRILC